MTNVIYAETLNKSGYSVNLSGIVPHTGYMVSIPGCEEQIKITEFNKQKIASFIRRNRQLLSNSRTFVGTWINEGVVYLDVSVNLMNLRTAKSFGMSSNQLAIFDIKHSETININQQ